MPFLLIQCLVAILGAATTRAHMQMSDPLPLRSPLDPYVDYTLKDYSMTSPLNADGSNFPCKGYQVDTQEQPVAQYDAGQSYTMSIAGGAGHLGGSCQLSLSYDGGQSFHVIKSIIGGCAAEAGSYDFTIPSIAPTGRALFAWSWINFEGNREYYMNCAVVEIAGDSTDTTQLSADLPNLFVANLAGINDCIIPEATNAVYPNPGCDVEYGGGESSASLPFEGSCDNDSGPGVDWCSGDTGSVDGIPLVGAPHVDAGTPSLVNGYTVVSPSSTTISTTTSIYLTRLTTTTVYQPGYPPSSNPAPYLTTSPGYLLTTLATVVKSRSSHLRPSNVPRPELPYAGGDPNASYLPCKLGNFLCGSRRSFYTCQPGEAGGYQYGPRQPVAAGMMCQPHWSGRRDDRIVRARPHGGCRDEGAMRCTMDGAAFLMCAQGAWLDMGSVAEGTRCVNGTIVDGR